MDTVDPNNPKNLRTKNPINSPENPTNPVNPENPLPAKSTGTLQPWPSMLAAAAALRCGEELGFWGLGLQGIYLEVHG